MPRTAPITSLQIDLLMDIEAAFDELAEADGFISPQEAELKLLIRRAVIKGLKIHTAHKRVKNILDNGEIVANDIRQDRELKRDIAVLETDMGRVVRLEDYRVDTQTPA